jgi:hypothetical protein
MTTPLPSFRVHFEDGAKVVVSAATADHARKIAAGRHDGIITKIKRVKDEVA